MRKHLVTIAALLLVVAVAMPAFAVEFKYGGEFRVRFINNDKNLSDGINQPGPGVPKALNSNNNQLMFDQRLRMYFTFIGSENLRVVTGFEVGDVIWGRSGNRLGASSGGNTGADAVNLETKRAYIEFNIPQTTATAFVGIQGVNLLSSWIIDDDFSAAIIRAKFDPVTAKVGYVAGQVSDNIGDSAGTLWGSRIDSWFLSLDYKDAGPFSGSLIGYYQFAHDTLASAEPAVMWTPSTSGFGASYANGAYGKATAAEMQTAAKNGTDLPASKTPSWLKNYGSGTIPSGENAVGQVAYWGHRAQGAITDPATGKTLKAADQDLFFNSYRNLYQESVLSNQFTGAFGPAAGRNQSPLSVKNNNLFDLGLNLNYKIDWISAYFNFVKNLGAIDVYNDNYQNKIGADYQGYMFDIGANFFCGPYTFNIGGFYTSGDKLKIQESRQVGPQYVYGTSQYNSTNINRFVYPRSTQKYFSEIVGGGILDNNQNIAHTNASGDRDYQWEGYGWPSNVWTVTIGGAWQALEKTKLSGSYWYFGTSNPVLGKGGFRASDIGHELDFYLTQGIVDGLNLDLVAAYLIKGDAYTAAVKADDAYELGARLIWSF